MACTLLIRGGNIDLSPVEAFTKVRRRIDAAKKQRLDYSLGNSDKFGDGSVTEMAFYTDLGEDDDGNQMTGRIFVDVAEVIGVMSDEYKDKGGPYKPEKEDANGDDEDDDE
jgi:hypothetical protein